MTILRGVTAYRERVILPSLEASISLAGTESSETMTITNNNPLHPVAVTMSDSLGYITWLSPHDGTADYVISAGGTLDVSFERSGSMPSSGGPYDTTVQATVSDGGVSEVSVELYPLSSVAALLAALSSAVYVHDFTSVSPILDTKSIGDLTLSGATVNNAPPSGSGFLKTMVVDAQTEYAQFTATPNEVGGLSGQARSIIIALQVKSTNVSGSERPVYGGTDDGHTLVGLRGRGSLSEALRATPGNIAGGTIITVNSGALLDMSPAADYLSLIVASWDGTNTLSLHTRSEGDGSWSTQSVNPGGADAASAVDHAIKLSGNATAALLSEWGAFCIRDAETTTAELATVVSLMGGL